MTMRKIKKALCVFASVAMLLCLCSCMAMETGLVINKDGTVRVFCDTTVEEDMLTQMEMTKEDFLASISESESSEEYEDFEAEAIEKEVDGKNHIGQRYYKDMTVEELNAYEQGTESNVSAKYSVVEEGGKLTVTITYTNTGVQGEEATDELSGYIAEGMMTTMQSVTAPYTILETNGKPDNETGTVTWDTLEVFTGEVSEATYTVTYKTSSFPLVPVIIIAAVVIIAVIIVIIVLCTRKSGGNSADFGTAAESFAAPSVQEKLAQTEAEGAIPVQEVTEEKKPEYCEICGMKLNGVDKFCPGCGEKV